MNFSEIPLVESTERGEIAFTRSAFYEEQRPKSVWDIYTMGANGTNLRQLTYNASAYQFSLSPDGTQFAYIRQIYEGVPSLTDYGVASYEEFVQKGMAGELPDVPNKVTVTFQLCIINVDGSGQKCLETASNLYSLLWLPDSKHLVYSTRITESNFAEYLIHINGSASRLIEAGDIPQILSETWKPNSYQYVEYRILSPDGTKLALIGIDKGGQAFLDVIDIEDEASTQLAYAKNEYNTLIPAWSPDGENIAFVALPQEHDRWWDYNDSEALFVLNVRSGDIRKLVDVDFGGQSRYEVYPYAPVWSPDGSRIAFIGLYDPKNRTDDIYLINPDGTDLRRVTTDGLPKANLVWLP